MITKASFQYLKDLTNNNHKEWFDSNKSRYNMAHEEMIGFAEELMIHMNKHDQLVPMTGKKSLFRIYRDVRFSKDKTPYKNYFAGRLKRDTDWLRGGYYYKVQPGGNSMVGCGFWNPNPSDLKLIREQISADPTPLRKILNAKKFKELFGELEGDQVKTAPKGFSKEDPAIDLLRYKQFIVGRKFTDKEVLDKNFVKEVNKSFKGVRPFFDYMSEILTHDLNGLPLY